MVDPISVKLFKDDAYCQEFYNTKKDLWTSTEKLSSFLGRANEFDVIFIVGGFGRTLDPNPHLLDFIPFAPLKSNRGLINS